VKRSCSSIIKSRLEEELKETRVTLPRYIAVGIGGVVIGIVTIWCFTELVGLFYIVSGCLGAFFSILNDFTFNEIWTFSYRRRKGLSTIKLMKRFAKFFLSKVAGFLICISVLALLTQVIGFHYLISNLFAIGASFVWNYTTSTFWVWTRMR
jgi:dolichol-phosphate mannosyltransferase